MSDNTLLDQTPDGANAQAVAEPEKAAVKQPAPPPKPSLIVSLSLFLLFAVAACALGYAIHKGIVSRVLAESALTQQTSQMAIPDVTVVHPKNTGAIEEIVLPGNIQAFTDTPIYARTNGYLRKWYADIGARVKASQLLAEIETPEIDQQLQQARADLATAQANYALAESTAKRYQFLLKTDSVSQQETDNTVGDLNAKKAVVDSNSANVRRLEQTQGFQKIYAPFDGVITARNTDIGALIAAANTTGQELFREAATNTLRVYVNVPQVYSRAAAVGSTADLTLNEFPGRRFRGALVRTADSIDPASRTLLTEFDVNNDSGELFPGAYASVHIKLPSKGRALTVPVNALLFRSEGLRVAVVRNGHAQLVPFTMGRDFGSEVEVVAGLTPADEIIVNPADSLTAGTEVHASTAAGGAK
jgi:RND family efflux transporter MFP subunit